MSGTSRTKDSKDSHSSNFKTREGQKRQFPASGLHPDLLDLQQTAGNRAVGELLSGGGEPLDEGTRAFMESRFDADFSHVRVHKDGEASKTAEGFSARALTQGSNIVFREGAYQPGTDAGERLIAHELTHVIQQNGDRPEASSPDPGSVNIGEPADRFEQEAELASESLDGTSPIQATPASSAPAMQFFLEDYIPDSVEALGDRAARSAMEYLGILNRDTVKGGLEYAISNGVIWSLLKQHPQIAAHALAIEQFRDQPGALNFLLDVFINPKDAKAKSKAFFTPHIRDGEKLIKDHGDVILSDLNVPEEYRETLWSGLSMLSDVAYSAAEMVVFDVVLDTLFFWNLQSEHDIFEGAWKNYNEGKTDTIDFIVEMLSIIMNLVGRVADLAPVIITLGGGLVGTGAGGTVGSVAPGAGTAIGGGAGGGTGTTAGVAASEVLGLAMLIGPAVIEQGKLTKAIGQLSFQEQTEAQRKQDVSQIFSSIIAMVFMGVLAFLPGFAMRLGKKMGAFVIKQLPDLSAFLSRASLNILGLLQTTGPITSPANTSTKARVSPSPAITTKPPRKGDSSSPEINTPLGGFADGPVISTPVQTTAPPVTKGVESAAELEVPVHPRIAERIEHVKREKASGKKTASESKSTDADNMHQLFPDKPLDEGPKPTSPQENALLVEEQQSLLGTGTEGILIESTPHISRRDQPRAMAGGDPKDPDRPGIPNPDRDNVEPLPERDPGEPVPQRLPEPPPQRDSRPLNRIADEQVAEITEAINQAVDTPEPVPVAEVEQVPDHPAQVENEVILVDDSGYHERQEAQERDLQEVLISPVPGVVYSPTESGLRNAPEAEIAEALAQRTPETPVAPADQGQLDEILDVPEVQESERPAGFVDMEEDWIEVYEESGTYTDINQDAIDTIPPGEGTRERVTVDSVSEESRTDSAIDSERDSSLIDPDPDEIDTVIIDRRTRQETPTHVPAEDDIDTVIIEGRTRQENPTHVPAEDDIDTVIIERRTRQENPTLVPVEDDIDTVIIEGRTRQENPTLVPAEEQIPDWPEVGRHERVWIERGPSKQGASGTQGRLRPANPPDSASINREKEIKLPGSVQRQQQISGRPRPSDPLRSSSETLPGSPSAPVARSQTRLEKFRDWIRKGEENDVHYDNLSALDKFFYDIGQRTFPGKKYEAMKEELEAHVAGKTGEEYVKGVVERGKMLFSKYPIGSIFNVADFFGGIKHTIGTGPTPQLRKVLKFLLRMKDDK